VTITRIISAASFTARITHSAATSCPPPAWLTTAIATPPRLSLASLVIHSARHFAASVNPATCGSGTTTSQAAADAAWFIIAMMRPTVSGSRIVFTNPGDPDVVRLAMELLGVGAALALLDVAKAIDPRTITKLSSRFDFQACPPSATIPLLIEAKGSLDGQSRAKQRASIVRKMRSLPTRTFSSAVGTIFMARTSVPARESTADFEVLDPPNDGRPVSLPPLLAEHYAKVYEMAGSSTGAEKLRTFARGAESPDRASRIFGARPLNGYAFGRVSQSILIDGTRRRYKGGFFSSQSSHPLQVENLASSSFIFIGVDVAIPALFAAAQIGDVVRYVSPEASFSFSIPLYEAPLAGTSRSYKGTAHLMRDGTVYIWSNSIPARDLGIEVPAS
jgi:hypothetical protein